MLACHSYRFIAAVTVALFAIPAPGSKAQAELPSIRFDRIHPMGIAAGESIEVEVSGRDTEEANDLRLGHPGLTSEFVKPGRFKVTATADIPEGTYDVWLIGRFGVSNPRLIAVGRDLTSVQEVEPNNTAVQAQTISINSAVFGTSDGNGQDLFRIEAKKGDRLTIDCQAQQLDSALDANLILESATGQILAANGDYHGRDPFIDFIVRDDGAYMITVHDLSYRGGFPYRLVVTNRPHVENVFPRAVESGKTAELAALGRNLQTQQFFDAAPDESPLEIFRFPFSMPSHLAPEGRYTFLEHPSDYSVLPTAATCTLDGCQVRVPIGKGALHPISLVASSSPVVLEAEPNNEKGNPQSINLPAMVCGRFDKPRDADWFSFQVSENGNYVFEVFSERIGAGADPYLVVIDEKDNVVAEFDDYGHRINAFDGHLRDPYGTASLQAKQTYRVLVQDRYGRGGSRYQYVLAIRKPNPDFHVAAIHSENPGPAGTNLRRGGASFVDVVVHQHDGHDQPITITAEDLPAGVHAAPTVINNNSRGVFVLWADLNAGEVNAPIRLVASGAVEGKTLRREVRMTTRVWTEPNLSASQPMREFVIGVRESAPYMLKIVPEQATIEAGQKAQLKLTATRIWPEFKEKITVIPLAFPGQFNFGSFDVAAGSAEAPLVIDIQPNTPPGEYTLSVLGQAQVPYNKNVNAAQKPNTLVSTPSLPVTLKIVSPSKK